MTKFVQLHAIHTHYDKDTTVSTYPVTINLEKITYFYPETGYQFFEKIEIPVGMDKNSIDEGPTMIMLGSHSIRVLESYKHMKKLLWDWCDSEVV